MWIHSLSSSILDAECSGYLSCMVAFSCTMHTAHNIVGAQWSRAIGFVVMMLAATQDSVAYVAELVKHLAVSRIP